jgi:hypothetical protein
LSDYNASEIKLKRRNKIMIINNINSAPSNKQNFGMALKAEKGVVENLAATYVNHAPKYVKRIVDTFEAVQKEQSQNNLFDVVTGLNDKGRFVAHVVDNTQSPAKITNTIKTRLFLGPSGVLESASNIAAEKYKNYSAMTDGLNKLKMPVAEKPANKPSHGIKVGF